MTEVRKQEGDLFVAYRETKYNGLNFYLYVQNTPFPKQLYDEIHSVTARPQEDGMWAIYQNHMEWVRDIPEATAKRWFRNLCNRYKRAFGFEVKEAEEA